MKFTDGNWLMQPGVRAFYPAEAHEVEADADALTIIATRSINHRGDTLMGPLLTVRLSSPMTDVIRVRVTHFSADGIEGRTFRSFRKARTMFPSASETMRQY